MQRKKILLVGYGVVGKILFGELSLMGDVYVCDVSRKALKLVPKTARKGTSVPDEFFDAAFICVPTEQCPDGSADTTIVQAAAGAIKADVTVIRSTVPVGTTDSLVQALNNRSIIFSPEFTSAGVHAGKHDFMVLGGDAGACRKVIQLVSPAKSADFRFICVSSREAEMSKYMLNCFLALKVTFCNEIAECCAQSGIDYNAVRNIFISDSRINPSHTFVYSEQPYYDNHCFNKDVPAFVSRYPAKARLVRACLEENKRMKEARAADAGAEKSR